MEAVTHEVNTMRGFNQWAVNARKTHCPQGHEYNVKNTRLYEGRRYCRACDSVRSSSAHRKAIAS